MNHLTERQIRENILTFHEIHFWIGNSGNESTMHQFGHTEKKNHFSLKITIWNPLAKWDPVEHSKGCVPIQKQRARVWLLGTLFLRHSWFLWQITEFQLISGPKCLLTNVKVTTKKVWNRKETILCGTISDMVLLANWLKYNFHKNNTNILPSYEYFHCIQKKSTMNLEISLIQFWCECFGKWN